MAKSQGAQANFTGKSFEAFIEAQLVECGYHKVADKKNFAARMAAATEKARKSGSGSKPTTASSTSLTSKSS